MQVKDVYTLTKGYASIRFKSSSRHHQLSKNQYLTPLQASKKRPDPAGFCPKIKAELNARRKKRLTAEPAKPEKRPRRKSRYKRRIPSPKVIAQYNPSKVVANSDMAKVEWYRTNPHADLALYRPLEFLIHMVARSAALSDECVPWPFAVEPSSGYGAIKYNGKKYTAHRMALIIASGGHDSPGMDAAHKPVVCHNRGCCNPLHIRWATRSENSLDKRLDQTIPAQSKPGYVQRRSS